MKSAIAEIRQLRGIRRRLLALDGPGTCPCCPRMEGHPHYADCAIFKERAVRFVVEESEKLRGARRFNLT